MKLEFKKLRIMSKANNVHNSTHLHISQINSGVAELACACTINCELFSTFKNAIKGSYGGTALDGAFEEPDALPLSSFLAFAL
jgi:hypothetical protein